jgi:hypothetical protein
MGKSIHFLVFLCAISAHAQQRAQNLIFITIDGLRWQEVFGGIDPLLNTKEGGGVSSPPRVDKLYKRDSAEESRAAIMPFLWATLASKGQLFGDRGKKNVGVVTNKLNFSYPGYAELLTGHVDPKISSNDDIPNPNVTVLEWLHTRPGFEKGVAVFGAWDRIRAIMNPQRSKLPVLAGWEPIWEVYDKPLTPRELALNQLMTTTVRLWPEEPPDSFTSEAAMEYFIKHKPRILYVSLGETDEWAHSRRYDLYLEAAKQSDAFIKRIWETAQSMSEYNDKTAMIVTTDHGRGISPRDWTDHGKNTPGSEGWWAAAMGPGIVAAGVRGEGRVIQAQMAATIAAALDQDWRAAEPKAAEPLDVFDRK